jgi:hypothetical protein
MPLPITAILQVKILRFSVWPPMAGRRGAFLPNARLKLDQHAARNIHPTPVKARAMT